MNPLTDMRRVIEGARGTFSLPVTIRAQQRHDWRNHTLFTTLVIEATLDGRESQRRAALTRLMTNLDEIAGNTAQQAEAKGKHIDRVPLTIALREHIEQAVAIVGAMVDAWAFADVPPSDGQYEEQLARGLFTPLRRVALIDATGIDLEAGSGKPVITSTAQAIRTIATLGASVNRARPSQAINDSATRLALLLQKWYKHANRVVEPLLPLSVALRAEKRALLELFYTHLEKTIVETARYYFGRYAAWTESVGDGAEHIEKLADTIFFAIVN